MGKEPECFDSHEDWIQFCRFAREAHDRRGRFTRIVAARSACDSCDLYTQFKEIARGRCHPPEGAVTPRMRKDMGINDLEDEE